MKNSLRPINRTILKLEQVIKDIRVYIPEIKKYLEDHGLYTGIKLFLRVHPEISHSRSLIADAFRRAEAEQPQQDTSQKKNSSDEFANYQGAPLESIPESLIDRILGYSNRENSRRGVNKRRDFY